MWWCFLCLHLFLFHFSSFSSSSSSSFNFSCSHEESSALLQFESSFTKSSNYFYYYDYDDYSYLPIKHHTKTSTWKNGTDCCSWHGVTCDTISGHVIGLDLGCEGLRGELHSNSTLFHLVHLQTLNLSLNNFSGSQIHSKFGGFLSLKHLNLSNCEFQGEVPTQISHLSKLESLHLSWNYDLVWKETTLKRFVQNTTNLKELFLDETNISSIRPNSMDLIFNQSSTLVTLSLINTKLSGNFKNSVLCLPSIQELYMKDNYELQDQLPKLSCSTSLVILDISNCKFQGPIPLSFSNLTLLTFLSLKDNNLNSSIPSPLLTFPQLTILNLKNNRLSGQIPNVFPQSNIFQELDLSANEIGGELPSSFSNLQQLIHLDLSYNLFSGEIPNMFGGMTKLQILSLHSNNLKGQIPSSLFNLTQLDTLDCSTNKLDGPLPNKVTGFQKLISMKLNDNKLNGAIPSWCLSLRTLVYLDLSNNQLTGPINAISSYSLDLLSLCDNKLQGNFPESIFNLANLTYLCLSSNNLSGVIDFQHFSRLQNLYYLSLSHNSQLSLIIESNVNYNFSQLTELRLSSLSLTKFPKFSGKLPIFDYLDLSNNKLNGRVPNRLLEMMTGFLNLSQNLFTSIEKISRNSYLLNGLDLSFNLLHGELPVSICNMSGLQMLYLTNNKLAGNFPQCLADFSDLEVLDLQMNNFHGTLPSNFPKYYELKILNLYGNQLEGHFPKSLSNCTSLKVLNLGNNKIKDNFPDWLQSLPQLKVLILRDNKLHGPISSITIKHPFSSLIILDISGNNFSGLLPKIILKNYGAMMELPEVGANSFLQYIYMSLHDTLVYFSVTVTTKGMKTTLVQIPKLFVSIDLSRNKFEGGIPDVIGQLRALKGLNLSHNKLNGHIPQSLGNLTNLESLDLSSNMLTGVIPAELTNMISLEVLNVSKNLLVGEIPQGKQFSTFTNDSYEANLGLCGFPLSMECGPKKHSPPSPENFWSEEKFGFGWKPVAIGYGCGTVIGIGLGYCVFLIGKPRWLVMLFGGQPKRRVRRRTRVRRTRSSTMNQMIQMS